MFSSLQANLLKNQFQKNKINGTYDENKSSANNSLYVFTLRNNTNKTKHFLKFLTGFLNSKLVTFFAQKRRIIRYNQGKQPQIKISDLYQLNIPINIELQDKISGLVDKIYTNNLHTEDLKQQIDEMIFKYYGITTQEVNFINESIKEFLL